MEYKKPIRLSLTPVIEKEGLFEGVKSDGKKYTVRKDRHRIFTPKEWIKFLEQIKDNKKILFETLLQTGARINEVLNIKKEDIDFNNRTIVLKVIKKRTPYSDGKIRIIKISSQYAEKLNIYVSNINGDEKLFPITKQGVSQMFKRGLKRAGLNSWEFSLHNIRKTMECWLNFLGSNYLLILKHLGHDESTSVNHYLTTDIYNSSYKFKAREILGDLYM